MPESIGVFVIDDWLKNITVWIEGLRLSVGGGSVRGMGIIHWLGTNLHSLKYWASNLFAVETINATITALVGALAIYLYKKQSWDFKRDKAKLILQEIKIAESLVKDANTPFGYPTYQRLLPTDTWRPNIQLFIDDLSESELKHINAFYARSHEIDNQIEALSIQRNEAHKTIKVPPHLYKESQDKLLRGDGSNNFTHGRIIEISKLIREEPITNSPIENRLHSLSLTLTQRIWKNVFGV